MINKQCTFSPEITSAQVEEYLRKNPEFFNEHLNLLEEMTIPHPSGNAVSLISKQLEIYRGKHQELERQLASKKDLVVPSSLLRHDTDDTGDTRIVIEEGGVPARYGVTPLARRQLADKLKIPYAYFERMRGEQPVLLDRNVNTWLQSEDDRRMIRTLSRISSPKPCARRSASATRKSSARRKKAASARRASRYRYPPSSCPSINPPASRT